MMKSYDPRNGWNRLSADMVMCSLEIFADVAAARLELEAWRVVPRPLLTSPLVP